jgi:predicted secreted hydrolase
MRLVRIALASLLALATLAAAPLRTHDGFLNANVPWHFVFPRDHAAHDGFASEWWYYTGHLRTGDGRRFGFELTFFRIGLRPGAALPARGQSRWRGNELYPAHFALTDERGERFFHVEKFARAALGEGSASTHDLDVRVDDWSLTGPAPFHLVAHAGGNAIDLALTSEKPPAIHGHDGISTKAACDTCASHYYSMTRLRTRGTLVYGGQKLAIVDGLTWMDHEFGSDELQTNQAGWDWFAIQLDDRREFMLYLLRQKDGTVTPASSGSYIAPDGTVTYLPRNAFIVTATGRWTSPHTGGTYPSGWRVQIPRLGVDLHVTPTVQDQELSNTVGGVSYWEGSVTIAGAADRPIGVGYVELTGYAGAISI